MGQWRDDVDCLLGIAHIGSVRPRPQSSRRQYEASASVCSPSVRAAPTRNLWVELNRRRAAEDTQVPPERPEDLWDELNRSRAGKNARLSLGRARECHRSLGGHNLEQDFAAVAPQGPGDARFQTSMSLAEVGCAALTDHLRAATWPTKFCPHLPEKYDGTTNTSEEEELRKNQKSQQQKFQEIHNQMARVRSTTRVDREGDDTEATETVPISEAMKRSGLVTSEDAPAAEVEQVDVEESESKDDYSSAVPSKPSHLEFGKSAISEGDLRKMLSLGYLSEAKKELNRFGGEETTSKPGKDEVVIFKSFFKAGLRFPLNKMIADVLKKFGIYLHQLTPNAIVRLSVYIWALRSQGVEPFAEGFCRVHELHYQTKARGDGLHENFGCYNFAYRKTTKFPVISYRSKWPAGWKSEWFYVKVDEEKEKLVQSPLELIFG
jgi:hypothetical protein